VVAAAKKHDRLDFDWQLSIIELPTAKGDVKMTSVWLLGWRVLPGSLGSLVGESAARGMPGVNPQKFTTD